MSTAMASSRRADVVILTAIALEYRAVLEVEAGAWPNSRWEEESGPTGLPIAFRSFRSSNKDRPLRVAVALAPDMGPVAATQALLPLVEAYDPACIAMCGVCAGRPGKTNLGDVIAAERLFFHDSGKRLPKQVQKDIKTYNLRDDWKIALERPEFAKRFHGESWCKNRPTPYEWQKDWLLKKLHEGVADPGSLPERELACSQWKKVIPALRRSGHLKKGSKLALTAKGKKRIKDVLLLNHGELPDPSPAGKDLPFRVHVAPMGSGNMVIEDKAYWGFVSEYMRKTLGLEMEAAAVGALAHAWRSHRDRQSRPLEAIVMKGVMDFANHGRDDHFKGFAARASAECLLAFLREHVNAGPGVDDLLLSGTDKLPENPTPSQLLTARYQVVDFERAARAEFLAHLNRWRDEGPNVAARLLHADGGVGKTRLAIQWIRDLREEGWAAGFLAPDLPNHWFERLRDDGRPVAVVLDYAETRPGLDKILERFRVHAQGADARKMRVLLLARNNGDWWTTLWKPDTPLGNWLKTVLVEKLEPLAPTAASREQVFDHAARAFAEKRKKRLPERPTPSLEDPQFNRVLYLHMAALAFVEGSVVTPHTLMDVVLDHEEKFWAVRAQGDTLKTIQQQRLARQMVAAATLRGGLDEQMALTIARTCLPRPLSNEDEELLRLLQQTYQGSGSVYLPALEPELLGEGMVLRIAKPPLAGDKPPADWIEKVFPPDEHSTAVETGFTVLGRASAVAPEAVQPWIERMLSGSLLQRAPLALVAAKKVGTQTAFSVLGKVLASQLETSGTASVAEALERVGVPHPTVSLTRVAEWSNRTLLGTLPQSEEEEVVAERARRLNNLGIQLRDLGRREEALTTTREAVDLCRILVQRHSDAFLSDLAMCLHNLGIRLNELGRPLESLDATRQAVDFRRVLAEHHPDAFLPDLAMSLDSLGSALTDLGRREEALEATRQANDLYRVLAQHSPNVFLPHLARSFNNLGNGLSSLRRWEEALDALRQAVDIYRSLAQRNPDAYLPYLATSQNNLGKPLGMLGLQGGALEATRQAIDIFRSLAQRNADAFLPELAMGLHNLGFRLYKLGLRTEALAAAEEALDTLWPFFERIPAAYTRDIGSMLTGLRKLHEALQKPLPPRLVERLATFERLTRS